MGIFSPKERVAVLRGGDRTTHRLALEHGATILDVLAQGNQYEPIDVVITPSSEWLLGGYVVTPAQVFDQVESVYNAALGAVGEDGRLARLCERFGIRQQSAPAHAAHRTWQKQLGVDTVRQSGIATPPRVVVSADSQGDLHNLVVRLHEAYGEQLVVKPAAGTLRTHVRKTNSVTGAVDAIEAVLAEYPSALVETYIVGIPLTVTSVPGLRQTALYHSPIMTWEDDFLSAESVDSTQEHLITAPLTTPDKQSVYDTVAAAYSATGVTGAVRTDLVITPTGEVYFLEINTLSPLTEHAAMTQSLASVGVGLDELLQHQLKHY